MIAPRPGVRATRSPSRVWLIVAWLGLIASHPPVGATARPVSLRDAALLMSGQLGGDLDVELATLQARGTVVALLSVSRRDKAADRRDDHGANDRCVATITAYVLDPDDTVLSSHRGEAATCHTGAPSPTARGMSVPLPWDLPNGSYRVRVLVRQEDRFALTQRTIEVDATRAGGWVAIEAGWSVEDLDPAVTTPLTIPDGATARAVIERGDRLVLATFLREATEAIWVAPASGTTRRLPLSSLGEEASASEPALRMFEADTSTLEPGTYGIRLGDDAPPALRLDVLPSTKARAPATNRRIDTDPLRDDSEKPSDVVVAGYRRALSDLIAGRREQAVDVLYRLETTLIEARGDAAYAAFDTATDHLEVVFEACPACRLPLARLFADLAHRYDETRSAALASAARARAHLWAQALASSDHDDWRRHAAGIVTRLAEDLQRSGLYGRAAEYFQTALDLAPAMVPPRALLAVLHEKHGRYREVVETLAPVADDPSLGDLARLRLAINQARTGRTSEARERIARLTRSTTPWIASLAWQERVRLAVEAEAWPAARRHLDHALARWPGQATFSVLDAWVRAQTEDTPAAAGRLHAPLRDHPEVDDARYRYHRWPVGVLDDDRRALDRAADTWLPRLAEALTGARQREPVR